MCASVWKKSRICQIGTVFSGGTPGTNVPEYWNGKIPFVTPNDLGYLEGPFIRSTERQITELGLNKSSANLLPKNSLVISSRAPIGYMGLTEKACVSNQGCKTIVFKDNQDPLFHYYNTRAYVGVMECLGCGTTFTEISKGDFEKVVVTYPSDIDVQKDIAKILWTCDRVIIESQKNIDKLKSIKQGMMRDLFSRGVAKDGKLRPSYEDSSKLYRLSEWGWIPKEWRIKPLGKLVSMHARIGWQNLRTSEFLESGEYYLITGTDFDKGKVNFDTCHYVGEERFNQDKNIQLEVGSILITKDGTLGKIAYIDKLDKPATLNAGVFNVRTTSDEIDGMFLYHFLASPALMEYASKTATGGTIKHLNQNILMKFPMLLPEKGEQIKIAERLNSINASLQKEEAVLEKYKKIKEGLMTRLLTPPDGAEIIDETKKD